MPKIFLKWYKNGGRSNGVMGFACAQKVDAALELFFFKVRQLLEFSFL